MVKTEQQLRSELFVKKEILKVQAQIRSLKKPKKKKEKGLRAKIRQLAMQQVGSKRILRKEPRTRVKITLPKPPQHRSVHFKQQFEEDRRQLFFT